MKIRLSNTGKRFNREWIFRKADIEFNAPTSYAITGPNGSGKSTLLQCIGGLLQTSEGNVSYAKDGPIEMEQVFRHISFCAPYLDVIEELNLVEFLQFHTAFKPLLKNLSVEKAIEVVGLENAALKQIRYYSSGMKQRVRLAQAIFSDTPVVLLDEPCSNLDSAGIALYHSLIEAYCKERLLIVCSNDEVEYSFCQERFSIMDFK